MSTVKRAIGNETYQIIRYFVDCVKQGKNTGSEQNLSSDTTKKDIPPKQDVFVVCNVFLGRITAYWKSPPYVQFPSRPSLLIVTVMVFVVFWAEVARKVIELALGVPDIVYVAFSFVLILCGIVNNE